MNILIFSTPLWKCTKKAWVQNVSFEKKKSHINVPSGL